MNQERESERERDGHSRPPYLYGFSPSFNTIVLELCLSKENSAQTAIGIWKSEIWAQDYKMQTPMNPNIQNEKLR